MKTITKTVNTFLKKEQHCKKCKPYKVISPRIPKVKGHKSVGFSVIRYNKSRSKAKVRFNYMKVKKK